MYLLKLLKRQWSFGRAWRESIETGIIEVTRLRGYYS